MTSSVVIFATVIMATATLRALIDSLIGLETEGWRWHVHDVAAQVAGGAIAFVVMTWR